LSLAKLKAELRVGELDRGRGSRKLDEAFQWPISAVEDLDEGLLGRPAFTSSTSAVSRRGVPEKSRAWSSWISSSVPLRRTLGRKSSVQTGGSPAGTHSAPVYSPSIPPTCSMQAT
jgi:hypothetical protein